MRQVLQFEKARAGGDNARVLQDAINTLDRRMHDSYLVWSIPLVLDPRYKLTYIEFSFRRAFGSKEAAYYISEVTQRSGNCILNTLNMMVQSIVQIQMVLQRQPLVALVC